MFKFFNALKQKTGLGAPATAALTEEQIECLYGVIMAAARRPALYGPGYAAPDTMDGRFDLLILHNYIIFNRLMRLPAPGPETAQSLADRMFRGFDDALREMGVGDLGVPKRIKKMAEAYAGRSRAYKAAFDAGTESESALAAALARNVYGSEDPDIARRLTQYALHAYKALSDASIDRFLKASGAQGALFPDPERIAHENDRNH